MTIMQYYKNNQGQNQDIGWFGEGGYLQTGAQGLQALGGLAQAYLGFQELWLRQRRLWTEYGNTHPLRRLYGGIQHHLVTFGHK